MKQDLQALFGDIDIYLFDQLLKGRFDNCRTVLDAGCGYGRNIHYLLKNGYDVYGIDQNHDAIEAVKKLAAEVAPGLSSNNFRVALVEEIPFTEVPFDIVICSAVLHFARNHQHFEQMLTALWRALKPGGYFFTRLASNIGIEPLVIPKGDGRYLLPDGSQRYLVDEKTLLHYTAALNGVLFEPIKTTNVQNLRCMTTWCVQKQ